MKLLIKTKNTILSLHPLNVCLSIFTTLFTVIGICSVYAGKYKYIYIWLDWNLKEYLLLLLWLLLLLLLDSNDIEIGAKFGKGGYVYLIFAVFLTAINGYLIYNKRY